MQTLIQELKAGKELPQGLYLHSLGVGMLAKSVFRALKIVLDQSALRSRRVNALAHLQDVVKIKAQDLTTPGSECFQDQTLAELRVSLASALEVLEAENADEALVDRLRLLCRELDVTLWADVGIGTKSNGWPLWAFWAEQNLQSLGRQDPTPIWTRVARRLSASAEQDWHLLQLYPCHQPRLIKTLEGRGSQLRSDDGGWLWDAISVARMTRSQLSRASRSSNVVAAVILRNEGGAQITLGNWERAVSELIRDDPFDPRGTEWMALEIFGRILKLVAGGRLPPHRLAHININIRGIPLDAQIELNLRSWDEWRPYARSMLTVSPRTNLLGDRRFISISMQHEPGGASLFVSIGLLLLGLLQHHFAFPTIWNLDGHRDVRLGSVFWYVRNLSVSSMTASMLDFCLGPRHFERRKRGGLLDLNAHKNETALPEYSELAALAEASALAQSILESHQTTIVRGEPRQLIPVDVHQPPLMRAIRSLRGPA
jgi:hypothetical protein